MSEFMQIGNAISNQITNLKLEIASLESQQRWDEADELLEEVAELEGVLLDHMLNVDCHEVFLQDQLLDYMESRKVIL